VFRRRFETAEEHNYWTPRKKATYIIAALNEPGCPHSIVHGVPTRATHKEVTEALRNRYGDHHLEAASYSQLKRRIQLVGESLQEFAAAIDHLVHRAHVQRHEHLISKQAAHAFAVGIRA
jgi:hypothetical protein